MDSDSATTWLHERLLSSDLMSHFFELRDDLGLSGDLVARTVFSLAHKFTLGDCLQLAAVLGEVSGADHVVTISRPDGRLLHAVFACAPQYPNERPRGDCVDIMGRMNLSDAIAGLEKAFGRVTIGVGKHWDDDFLDTEERGRIRSIAAALPWTRSFARLDGISPKDLMELTAPYRAAANEFYSIGDDSSAPAPSWSATI
ncbi:hypothetical protein [Bosea sp. ANAM02]|uniref:hypothetical protein n=1 Tax=Bosea sp. ANAM02 TaxID=2020412 RepID=UPI0015665A2B|nr:hypothetical protein [Bosea sp. ANAM02]